MRADLALAFQCTRDPELAKLMKAATTSELELFGTGVACAMRLPKHQYREGAAFILEALPVWFPAIKKAESRRLFLDYGLFLARQCEGQIARGIIPGGASAMPDVES